MDWKECPLYDQCQNVTDKLVSKEACDFRWEIIKKDLEDREKDNHRINDIERNIDVINAAQKTFSEFVKSINTRQGDVEEKIGKLISRNNMIDKQKKIHDDNKKRKQNIRDTIITAVVTAFIIGTLSGGWQIFKKVSMILEKPQAISQPAPIYVPQTYIPLLKSVPKEPLVPQAIYEPHDHK